MLHSISNSIVKFARIGRFRSILSCVLNCEFPVFKGPLIFTRQYELSKPNVYKLAFSSFVPQKKQKKRLLREGLLLFRLISKKSAIKLWSVMEIECETIRQPQKIIALLGKTMYSNDLPHLGNSLKFHNFGFPFGLQPTSNFRFISVRSSIEDFCFLWCTSLQFTRFNPNFRHRTKPEHWAM